MMKVKRAVSTLAILLTAGIVALGALPAQAGPHAANPQKWEHFSPLDTHSDPNVGAGAQYQMDQNAIQWWKGASTNASLPSWFNDPSQWQAMPGQGYALPKGALDQAQWQVFTDGHLGGWVDNNKDGLHDMFEFQTAWNTAGANQLGAWMDQNRDGIHDGFQVWAPNAGANPGNGNYGHGYDDDGFKGNSNHD